MFDRTSQSASHPVFPAEMRGLDAGSVALVGAGPGEPSAITLRAIECLQTADIVLYDYLVNPSLLNWAKNDAQLISLGSHKDGKRLLGQDEINQMMVDLARSGQSVVRLKSGDPIVFARSADETAVLTEAGIPFEIVPGVTSALAAGSFAGIPLTHRDHSSAVALVTGHRAAQQDRPRSPDQATDTTDDGCPSHIDWKALGKFPGTLVVYMGTTQVEYWSSQLMQGGMPAQTPVAIVRRCGFFDQKIWHCQLDQVADQVTSPSRIRPPVVFVIGKVADINLQMNWFQQRPLFRKRILITRPEHQGRDLQTTLERMGASVIHWPAIEIQEVSDTTELDQAIECLPTYDWIVYSSANGVDHWMRQLFAKGYDARQFAKVRIAAIGKKTAQRLKDYSLAADLVPETFDADHLAAQLAGQVTGQRVLLVRASRGREVLFQQLNAAGAEVQQVVAYNSVDATAPPSELMAQMNGGEIDWVVVTSSAIAKNTASGFGESLKQAKLASISPITSATLNQLGLTVAAEADTYTSQGVVDAIAAWENEPDSVPVNSTKKRSQP